MNEQNIMTPEEFAKRMANIFGYTSKAFYDQEGAHIDADDLMLELLRSLGYDEGCDIFDRSPKWYA